MIRVQPEPFENSGVGIDWIRQIGKVIIFDIPEKDDVYAQRIATTIRSVSSLKDDDESVVMVDPFQLKAEKYLVDGCINELTIIGSVVFLSFELFEDGTKYSTSVRGTFVELYKP